MIYSQMKVIKLNLKGILGIITLCMASLLAGVAYADEPIKITISDSLHVQFDGKWTTGYEWKASTYDKFQYDKNGAIARSGKINNKIVICSKKKNKKIFDLTVGGYGLTGIIISITLKLKKISSLFLDQKISSFL